MLNDLTERQTDSSGTGLGQLWDRSGTVLGQVWDRRVNMCLVGSAAFSEKSTVVELKPLTSIEVRKMKTSFSPVFNTSKGTCV